MVIEPLRGPALSIATQPARPDAKIVSGAQSFVEGWGGESAKSKSVFSNVGGHSLGERFSDGRCGMAPMVEADRDGRPRRTRASVAPRHLVACVACRALADILARLAALRLPGRAPPRAGDAPRASAGPAALLLQAAAGVAVPPMAAPPERRARPLVVALAAAAVFVVSAAVLAANAPPLVSKLLGQGESGPATVAVDARWRRCRDSPSCGARWRRRARHAFLLLPAPRPNRPRGGRAGAFACNPQPEVDAPRQGSLPHGVAVVPPHPGTKAGSSVTMGAPASRHPGERGAGGEGCGRAIQGLRRGDAPHRAGRLRGPGRQA